MDKGGLEEGLCPFSLPASVLPPVSLIICSRNRPEMLADTVRCVLACQELPAEIVVIDQSDQTNRVMIELQNSPGSLVRYIPSTTIGLSRARNLAIEAAGCEILAFLDDDMFVEPDWFGQLVRAQLEAGFNAAVTGRVLPLEGCPGSFVPSTIALNEPRVYSGRISDSVLSAGHMILHRGLVQAVGLFDERLGTGSRYPAAEDNDFCYRLLEKGFSIVYAPQAVVYHRAWRSQNEYNSLNWRYGRGEGGFYCKHFHLHDSYWMQRVLKDVSPRLVRFPWRYLHRPDLAVGDLFYSTGVLSGFLEWFLTGQRWSKWPHPPGPAVVHTRTDLNKGKDA